MQNHEIELLRAQAPPTRRRAEPLAQRRLAAEARGCELHYALVPKRSLAETLENRALALARRQMAAVSHSMALEAQATSGETVEAQTRTLAENLLKGSRRALWKEPGRGKSVP